MVEYKGLEFEITNIEVNLDKKATAEIVSKDSIPRAVINFVMNITHEDSKEMIHKDKIMGFMEITRYTYEVFTDSGYSISRGITLYETVGGRDNLITEYLQEKVESGHFDNVLLLNADDKMKEEISAIINSNVFESFEEEELNLENPKKYICDTGIVIIDIPTKSIVLMDKADNQLTKNLRVTRPVNDLAHSLKKRFGDERINDTVERALNNLKNEKKKR